MISIPNHFDLNNKTASINQQNWVKQNGDTSKKTYEYSQEL